MIGHLELHEIEFRTKVIFARYYYNEFVTGYFRNLERRLNERFSQKDTRSEYREKQSATDKKKNFSEAKCTEVAGTGYCTKPAPAPL
jgi:hypothetical protein